MDCAFYPDDIVELKSNERQLGLVERTYGDVDTHGPFPERSEFVPIRHDADIESAAFEQFLADGVPPKDTVLVRFEGTMNAQIISTSKLRLVDRSFLIGDVVKKNVHDAMSGVVINTFTKCTLQPICDVSYKGGRAIKGFLPSSQRIPLSDFQYTASGPAPPIVDVPACELTYAESPAENDLVIYKDWIGRILGISSFLTLKLLDNNVVEIPDVADHADGDVDALLVGDIVKTKKGDLRTGRWIYGKYNPNTLPIGTVVQTRVVEAEVEWLQRRIGSTEEQEPPAVLERPELESSNFHIYDRARRPNRATQTGRPEAFGSDSKECMETVSNSEIEIQLGQRVRFKDLAGACLKYDGSSAQGQVPRIDRMETSGYDINVFDIIRFETDVTVQWQDLTITKEKSINLIPDMEIDDDHAAWPGEIVHTLDILPVPNLPGAEFPSKVGVVQSVEAAERMVQIRWSTDASIHYASANGDSGVRPLVSATIGRATGVCEKVSLYDVEAPAAVNVRRGDIVLIAVKSWDPQHVGAPGPENLEWLGEIVDTCLDGTLIVRLGAADPVVDVNVRREDVIVAIRSDGTGGQDQWDDEEGDELDEFLEISEMEGVENEGSVDGWDEFHRDEGSRVMYLDENGQPMEEDEVENEEWESDIEEDVDMRDASSQFTPPTSTSSTFSGIEGPQDEIRDLSTSAPRLEEPPQYKILDSPVPSSHHYANDPPTSSAAHTKRTQKEHRILRRPNALPTGIYVRSWENRLDLIRVLILGPAETPYQDAPFVIDFYLPPQFPVDPPQAYFHSWVGESGLGGVGRVNPNLYEDGKICLSLLGTWEGDKGEGWNASRSTLLQVIVSLLGLVLVKDPYFNEAGYEPLAGLESSKRPSALYNERTYLKARTFVTTALSRDLEGITDAVLWSYLASTGPRLIDKVVSNVEEVLRRSEPGESEPDGYNVMSKGACIALRRVLARLHDLKCVGQTLIPGEGGDTIQETEKPSGEEASGVSRSDRETIETGAEAESSVD
ncbi:hypothetical protein M433DRAFT_147461 [Acidomyces richmondensis BFW]|nr:hypothetical protein M433DRAFT_147461 [Acidomyces richmondensis BFW]